MRACATLVITQAGNEALAVYDRVERQERMAGRATAGPVTRADREFYRDTHAQAQAVLRDQFSVSANDPLMAA